MVGRRTWRDPVDWIGAMFGSLHMAAPASGIRAEFCGDGRAEALAPAVADPCGAGRHTAALAR